MRKTKYTKKQTEKLKRHRFLFTIYFYGNLETEPIVVNIRTNDKDYEKTINSLMVVKEIRVYRGKKGEEILYKTIPVRSFLEGEICI